MIDLVKAKSVFEEYTSSYNTDDPKIRLKVIHINHVTGNSRRIAQDLGLSEEEQELAELIGLLHDIGRFEQIRLYGTFADDKSVDHAEKGVEVLFADNNIRSFINTNQYDSIIRKAISNHNKLKVEENLSEREQLHCKIIRDADKLDIFRCFLTDKLEDLVHMESTDVSAEILSPETCEEFKKEKLMVFANCKTNMDFIVCILAFIYDFNFKETLKIIKERDYINRIVQRVNAKDEYTREKLNEIQEYAMGYIQRRCINTE